MKKTPLIIRTILFVSVASLVACNAPRIDEKSSIDMSNSPRESLEWSGMYKGQLPCANECEGLDVKLSLYENGLFTRTDTFLGKDGIRFTESGDIYWSSNGKNVTLSTSTEETKFKVVEDGLILINNDTTELNNEIGAPYRLEKTE